MFFGKFTTISGVCLFALAAQAADFAELGTYQNRTQGCSAEISLYDIGGSGQLRVFVKGVDAAGGGLAAETLYLDPNHLTNFFEVPPGARGLEGEITANIFTKTFADLSGTSYRGDFEAGKNGRLYDLTVYLRFNKNNKLERFSFSKMYRFPDETNNGTFRVIYDEIYCRDLVELTR